VPRTVVNEVLQVEVRVGRKQASYTCARVREQVDCSTPVVLEYSSNQLLLTLQSVTSHLGSDSREFKLIRIMSCKYGSNYDHT
jgi:hypothetical protein